MGDHPLSVDQLKMIGMSDELLGKISEVSNSLKLKRKPDFIEWSLLSGLCLFNNHAVYEAKVDPNERQIIERIQVKGPFSDLLMTFKCLSHDLLMTFS